jgi:hypothetical protein
MTLAFGHIDTVLKKLWVPARGTDAAFKGDAFAAAGYPNACDRGALGASLLPGMPGLVWAVRMG